jgi:hypothetical protein
VENSAARDFGAFRAHVLGIDALQRELLAQVDAATFPAAVAAVAAREGFTVSEADVSDAIGAARRAWLERWV